MEHSQRICILLRCLLRGHARTGEVAKLCNVSARTIARDVALLTDVGVPIYTQPGRGGGLVLPVADETERRRLEQLVSRIERGTPDPVSLLAQHYVSRSQISEPPEFTHANSVLAQLHNALVSGGSVHLNYLGPNARVRRCTLRPMHLRRAEDGEWVLDARPVNSERPLPFHVSRIAKIIPSTASGKVMQRISPGWACRHVRFSFPASMAGVLLDTCSSSSLDESDCGEVLVTPTFLSDAWVVGFYLAVGAPVRTHGPAELLERALDEVNLIYRQFATYPRPVDVGWSENTCTVLPLVRSDS